ncbi:MAG: stage III sporulation protein AF [Ruminococcus sp.]|nr:stage III sporulation protein AF [Ruminococcus sp.]
MNGLGAVAVSVCCASLICALVSNFVSDSSVKRVLNLVLGAFMVCSLIFPVKSAVQGIREEISESSQSAVQSATVDEAQYNRQIVVETRKNLENTLTALLNQNGIYPESVEVILSVKHDKSIIISRIGIYIDKSCTQTDKILELTAQNFGITPNIITE